MRQSPCDGHLQGVVIFAVVIVVAIRLGTQLIVIAINYNIMIAIVIVIGKLNSIDCISFAI